MGPTLIEKWPPHGVENGGIVDENDLLLRNHGWGRYPLKVLQSFYPTLMGGHFPLEEPAHLDVKQIILCNMLSLLMSMKCNPENRGGGGTCKGHVY